MFIGIYGQKNEDICLRLGMVDNLKHLSFFATPSIREHLLFGSRLCCKQTHKGTRQTIKIPDVPFDCHTYVRRDGLCGIVITDEEYPQRIAFTLINRQLAGLNHFFLY